MDSRATFENLLAKNHVTYALVQDGDRQNNAPMSITTMFLLGGSPAQLRATYERNIRSLESWKLSPGRITNSRDGRKYLGDIRFQRAYMDYFSTQHAQLKGNYKALVDSQLADDAKPLMYGLFGGFGKAMITLSDAMEARNSILVVQTLVMASVNFSSEIHDILIDPRLDQPNEATANPDVILGRIAYDGRFSIKYAGPGWHNVSAVLSNASAKAALMDYLHQLDTRDPQLLSKLSRVSVLMLCAAHKKNLPAFDLYLSRPLSLVRSLHVLLNECHRQQLDWLVRGTWLLMILVYVTQLRPNLDESLISSFSGQESWGDLMEPLKADTETLEAKYFDPYFLRALRSLQILSSTVGDNESLYLKATQKLVHEWESWSGSGNSREPSLNIRL